MIARDLLRKIRKIEIHTNRLVNDQLAGHYHSVFKGRGMAFEEVRQYQPGDDVRLIDWNVSARSNDIFIKLFVEEREMTVMLIVDMSASGSFGTSPQNKREIIAEMAAVVAFSAIKNNDRVGLIIFTDHVEKFVPPKKGKKHVLRVISEILSYRPRRRQTQISAGLEFLGRVTKRRSVVFLMSDFIEETAPRTGQAPGSEMSASLERALRIVSRRHDLIPVTVADPLELDLPRAGLLSIADLETGEEILFDSSGPEGRAFAAHVRQSKLDRENLFRRLRLDFINVRTDQPYLASLVDFFRTRERRMKH